MKPRPHNLRDLLLDPLHLLPSHELRVHLQLIITLLPWTGNFKIIQICRLRNIIALIHLRQLRHRQLALHKHITPRHLTVKHAVAKLFLDSSLVLRQRILFFFLLLDKLLILQLPLRLHLGWHTLLS